MDDSIGRRVVSSPGPSRSASIKEVRQPNKIAITTPVPAFHWNLQLALTFTLSFSQRPSSYQFNRLPFKIILHQAIAHLQVFM